MRIQADTKTAEAQRHGVSKRVANKNARRTCNTQRTAGNGGNEQGENLRTHPALRTPQRPESCG